MGMDDLGKTTSVALPTSIEGNATASEATSHNAGSWSGKTPLDSLFPFAAGQIGVLI